MAESVAYSKEVSRASRYEEIIPQIDALIAGERDLVANLANTAAVLKEVFGFFWVGFYLEKNGELVLGPFQGPLACTRIKPGEGVCGTAFSNEETIIVPNVDEFPGHIACSSESKSEIVVPLIDENGVVFGVMDVDSDLLDDFDQDDKKGLESIAELIAKTMRS